MTQKLAFASPAAALVTLDCLLVAVTWWIAFWIRFNFEVPEEFQTLAMQSLPVAVGVYGAALVGFRMYRHVWRYTSLPELQRLALVVALAGGLVAACVLLLRFAYFPRSVLLLHPLLVAMVLSLVRAGWRSAAERAAKPARQGKRLLVLGSIEDAAVALTALQRSTDWVPIGIVSPLPEERFRSVRGIPVVGSLDELAAMAAMHRADAAVIASLPGSQARRRALLQTADAHITLLTMPRPDEWLQAEGAGPRRIELEDLLGRDPVALDVAALSNLFSGQAVLVTGAAGSIGSELCRQIARLGVGRLVCVDVSEYGIYALEQELRQAHPQMQGVYYTANVREPDRLEAILRRHRPAVVLHAAAYKHVPLMEELNQVEALRTNVLGTLNVARVAGQCGVKRFVMVSTDKAVNPTNVMGASKRLAELVVQGVAPLHPQTQYVSVRFGNVLGSSGSVVPLFTAQIARGGPVTVTHPDIVRYFMTIPEAAQLVLQAGLMGRSGQIFVLEMGEPMKIVELARMLIRLSGKSEEEVPITFSGLRPGEKLYEELLADDETTEPTPHPKLRVAKTGSGLPDVAAIEAWIHAAGAEPDDTKLRGWLRSQVPEYQPPMPPLMS